MRVRQPARGVTLMEILVGVAILAMLLAVGVPSLQQWTMGQRVASIGTEVLADMQYARSESISRASKIRMSFGGVAGSYTCYSVHVSNNPTLTTCDCTNPAGACSGINGNVELKTVKVATSTGVTIDTSADAVFQPNATVDLTAPPLSVLVADSGTKSIAITSTAMLRRPALCAPSTSTITSYPKCSCPLPGRSVC